MKKISKRKLRSEENKRKFREKRAAEAEARKATKKKIKKKKPAAKKPAAKKPEIEKSDVETTPWPRAADNKEFKEILDQVEPPKQEAKADKPEGPAETELNVDDVAEWVKWPFQLWSQSQGLQPIIRPEESVEIAKPLARILNRHGVSEKIPPDALDGMQVLGRTIPVIKRGNDMVKSERQRRAQAGQGPAAPGTAKRTPQGAPPTKPKEI